MTALRRVWESAWHDLPPPVHDAFSRQRKPLKAVVTGMFPTAFADLDASLRTYRRMSANPPVDEDQATLIRGAVAAATDTLVVAADNYGRMVAALDGDDLGMDNRVETLSRFAWRVATEQGPVEATEAAALLARAYPPAATLKNLHRALTDSSLVAALEAELASAVPCAAQPCEDGKDGAEVAALVDAVMGSTALAATRASTEPADLGPAELDAWHALLAHPGLVTVHRAAPALGLAHRLPVPVPTLTEDAPRPVERLTDHLGRGYEVMAPVRPLEQSVLARVRRALDVDREQLQHLTPERVLHDEARRVVAPLGLAEPGALAVFAIVRALAFELGQTRSSVRPAAGLAATPLPTTPVGQSFVKVVRAATAAKRGTGGYARASHDVLSTLDDPTTRYATELWGRTHGHVVRGSLDLTDLDAVYRQLLLGVRETLFRRLDDERGGLYTSADGVVPERDLDDPAEALLDKAAVRTRADALDAFLAALRSLAREQVASYAEVREFTSNAETEAWSDDPASYAGWWDRWRKASRAPEWLTYDVVCAVLPLIRRERPEDEDGDEGDRR